jgi:hypothetical protein
MLYLDLEIHSYIRINVKSPPYKTVEIMSTKLKIRQLLTVYYHWHPLDTNTNETSNTNHWHRPNLIFQKHNRAGSQITVKCEKSWTALVTFWTVQK